VEIDEEAYLMHYGTPRHSGRYPWGSGGNVDQSYTDNMRNMTFVDYVAHMRSEGMNDTDIASGMGMSTTKFRAKMSIEKNAVKQANIAMATRLKENGHSTNSIATRMGAPESTVRSWLEPGAKDKANILQTTSSMLKDQVAEKGFIDIGSGVENHIGVSSTMLTNSVAVLKEEGYVVYNVKVPQVLSGRDTNMKVLCPPGTTWGQLQSNRDKIQQITKFSDDHGRTNYGIHPPIQVNPKRVEVIYGSDGGAKADGVIYVRPGIDDLSLGGKKYAQVRIQVGEEHYLKGMAVLKNDLPDGVDLQFHTSKENTGRKLDAMKKLEDDPDNPFKSYIRRQIVDNPGKPDERVTSAMNIVNEEGRWAEWSKNLSSQMLSKQSRELAKTQLDMTYERRQNDYEAIMRLTNPTVRKKMLLAFADTTDSAAVHLQAASLPRQGVHVLLPISSIKPGEIYAPNYNDGERVVLIRHPHGGTFEIPELIVNNKNREGRKLLGDSNDAVGIHHTVAQWLSGADFDGDTVLVIPNNSNRVTTSPALEKLKNFDPRAAYPAYEGMKPMRNTQTEMGKISNLITDMSLRGASLDEKAAALRHSMVVIDAEKHNLNYKLSYNDNGIRKLKQKYQQQSEGGEGASTLISRRKSEIRIPHREPRRASQGGPINRETGELEFTPTGKVSYKTGQPLETKIGKLAYTKDAHTLSSGTPMEVLYANHSNKLKALANTARLDAVKTPTTKVNPSAKQAYAKEVDSLTHKLNLSIRNRPLERQANILANTLVKDKRNANPNMDEATLKKIKRQAIEEMRRRTQADAKRIDITQSEWDAIQAGAISESKLSQILMHADMDTIRKLATPKTDVLMSSSMTKRATDMLNLGYTRAQVAQQLGVSVSTLDKATVVSE